MKLLKHASILPLIALVFFSFSARAASLGSQGKSISDVQQSLVDLHYLSTAPSGVFGASTKTALQSFQQDYGIPQTGSVDGSTRLLLNAIGYVNNSPVLAIPVAPSAQTRTPATTGTPPTSTGTNPTPTQPAPTTPGTTPTTNPINPTTNNPQPTLTFSTDTTDAQVGDEVSLTWSTTNVTSCTGVGFTPNSTNGSISFTPTATQTYTITCAGSGGSVSQSVIINVSSTNPNPTPDPVPTLTICVDNSNVAAGTPINLTWSTIYATTCTGTGFSSSAVSGSMSFTPTQSSTYSLTCAGNGGSVTQSMPVTVQ
jgi:hypothetical protein